MKRMNDKIVGHVNTSNKHLERFAFQTAVLVFVAFGKRPTNMACLFNKTKSLQQLVQFFPTISKTPTPTPKMGRQFAQICSI